MKFKDINESASSYRTLQTAQDRCEKFCTSVGYYNRNGKPETLLSTYEHLREALYWMAVALCEVDPESFEGIKFGSPREIISAAEKVRKVLPTLKNF